jgi:Lamin Tail Domain/IPT/TIG domain
MRCWPNRCLLSLACVAALLGLTLVGPGAARADSSPGNKPLGVVKRAAGGRAVPSAPTGAPGARPSNTAIDPTLQLTYHGGPVMHTHAIHAIFWAPSGFPFPAGYQTAVEGFLQNVAVDSGKTSNAYGAISQYGDAFGPAQYNVTYSGSVLDTNSYPATDALNCGAAGFAPKCLTDEQLYTEIEAIRAAQGWSGGLAQQFALVLPPGVTTCIGGSLWDVCSDNYFCAYHSWDPRMSDATTNFYLNIPYEDPNVCHNDFVTTQPMPNGQADVAIDLISHEEREAATDPLGTAWFDANGNEADDKCIDSYGVLIGVNGSSIGYNQAIGVGQYDTQTEWSNALHGCYQMGKPTISSISPGSATAGSTVGITGTNFFAAYPSNPGVLFNGHPAATVTVDSSTHLTVTVPSGNVTGKVTVQAVGGNVVSTQTFGLQPEITSLSASSGFAGQSITVTGTGFFGVTSVKFNGAAGAFSAVAADGTSLHVVVPNAATTGTVTVTTAGGTGASLTTFAVLPHVTSFTPAAAVAGANVTISGTGFSGVPTVDFTGSAGAFLVSHTATSLVVHVPVDALIGPLTVTTADGSSASIASFKPLPKITSFDAATYQAGDTVTVNGSNFTANGPLTAKLGAISLSPGSVTATSFQFTVPDNGLTGAVTATNLDGSATSPTTLKVRPTITGDPAPNEAKAGDHIVLTGKTFTGTLSVKFNGTVVAPFAVGVGGTSLNVTVPAAAVDGPIAVTNAGGTTNTVSPFKVDPKLASFAPLAAAGGSNVTITGTGFGASPVVQFTGSAGPATLGLHTATSIVAVVPSDARNGPITVATANGDAVSVASFKALLKITGFGAANYQAGDTVTVNGSNFLGTGSNPTAKLGVLAVTPGSVTDTSFQFTVPDNGLTGTVSATNANGTASSPTTLKIRPTITGDPAPNEAKAGDHIVLTGKTFTGTLSVKFGNNTQAAAFTIGAGGTSLTVTVPNNATIGKIGVTNAGGLTQTANNFTIDPRINSFSPTSGAVGLVVTVSGTGFGGADRVNFAGGVFGVPTNVTATSLKVAVPAGATSGPITVHTPAGTSAPSAASFTVTFSVTSISPTSAIYNHDVTITGIGLTGVTAVKFNNVAGAIVSNTGTIIHVNAPASGAISGNVTVWKGTANITAPQQFSLLDVTSFLPSTATPGTDILITGHGFSGATAVSFNGAGATFTVDSGTQITAQVPEASSSGTVSVTGPGGTATSSGSFTVQSLDAVKINEVQTDGVTAHDEFVELFNGGATSANISGCKLVYRTASGTSDIVLATVPASTSIAAGGYYLFAGSDYGGAATADLSFSTDLDATNGALALRYPSGTIVDLLGYGTLTNNFFEAAAAPSPPSGQSIGRDPTGADTDDNSADFGMIASPTPRLVNP